MGDEIAKVEIVETSWRAAGKPRRWGEGAKLKQRAGKGSKLLADTWGAVRSHKGATKESQTSHKRATKRVGKP